MHNRDYTITEMLKHILSQSFVAIVAIAITFLATGSFSLKKILISSIAIIVAHLQSSVFKLSKDLIDSIHEEGIVAYTS